MPEKSKVFVTLYKVFAQVFLQRFVGIADLGTSQICSIHTNKRAFTEHDHDEVINEKETCFPHIMSSLGWKLFTKYSEKRYNGVEKESLTK